MSLYEELTKEQKAAAIDKKYAAERAKIDAEKRKNIKNIWTKGAAGAALMGASMLPIFNIPYVGTGIGGAMYGAGDSIAKGEKLKDIANNAKTGFIVGESVGAIPYVGKFAGKTKPVQKALSSATAKNIGNALNKAGEKIAQSKVYDALMTDIKAFNPNKQTAYHGSPYDFNKFSNEAIGTGEGAQAHGYGHYAALDKDIADKRYRQKLLDNTQSNYIIDDVLLDGNYPLVNHNFNPESVIKDAEYYGGTNKLLEKYKKDYAEAIEEQARIKSKYSENADPYRDFDDIDQMLYSNANILEKNLKSKIPFLDSIKDKKITQNEGQLYKLSVPKDDVMLREDDLLSTQPNIAKIWDEVRLDRVNKATTSLPKFKMALAANDIDIQKAFNTRYFEDALEKARNNPEKYKDLFLNQEMTGKHLYGYLENILGSRKAANEYLQQRGIKGISYNGGIDGEARVIFNPEDIDIVRKYYNQPSLWQYLNPNVGSESELFNRLRQ